jgi:hypothetical protein
VVKTIEFKKEDITWEDFAQYGKIFHADKTLCVARWGLGGIPTCLEAGKGDMVNLDWVPRKYLPVWISVEKLDNGFIAIVCLWPVGEAPTRTECRIPGRWVRDETLRERWGLGKLVEQEGWKPFAGQWSREWSLKLGGEG